MKRERASERAAITARPRRRSSSRSAGRAFRASRLSRLPAIDLIGARELLSSWPRTRIRRCQACRSSSRRARLTLARTSMRWGSPPCRNVLPRASKRPALPSGLRRAQRLPEPQLLGAPAEELLGRPVEEPLPRAVHQAQAALVVEREHRHVDLLHDLAQEGGGLEGAQALLAQGVRVRVHLLHRLGERIVALRA